MKRLAPFLAGLLAAVLLALAPPASALAGSQRAAVLTAPTFTPKKLPGLVAWYDAADSSTVTLVSGNVSQWRDKSVLANTVSQATASKQPSYGVSTLNGRALIKFDGVDDNLVGTDAGLPSGTSDRTGFAVHRCISGNWGGPGYGSPGNINAVFAMTQSSTVFVQGWGGGLDYNSGFTTPAAAYQHTAIHSAQVLTQRVNGSQKSSAATTINTVLNSFRIGSEQNAINFSGWEVAEYILFNRALSAAEIAKVEAYQRSPKRWGTP